jgi:hypothetical protein
LYFYSFERNHDLSNDAFYLWFIYTNMEFKLFGLTFRLEVVIICVILGILMGAHLLCSCCRYPITSLFEGYEVSANDKEKVKEATKDIIAANKQINAATAPPAKPEGFDIMENARNMASKLSEGMGLLAPEKKAAEGEVSPLTSFIATLSGGSKKEGLQTMGASVNETNNADIASSWISKATNFASDFGYTDKNKSSQSFVGTEVPLPEGELFLFAKNQFKPECCPSIYSSTGGCACISNEQMNYLNTRGGNRTSDSEY